MSCPCRPLFSKVLRKERLAQVCAIFILKRTDLKLFVIFNNRKLYFAKLRKFLTFYCKKDKNMLNLRKSDMKSPRHNYRHTYV